MSSATPIENGFRTWHFFVLASLATATAALLLSPPTSPARLVLISMAIGAAGLTASALYRTLAPLAGRDTAIAEPLDRGTRAALEKDKALALRAIKDLEFDAAMGKVAPGDYDDMMGRLRARAAGLIARLEDDVRRGPVGRRRNRPAKPTRSARE
jgi:hypothetical protein